MTSYKLTGTKAETLSELESLGFNVPSVYYFTVNEWNNDANNIIEEIARKFEGKILAVRSSSLAEDTMESSMAGAFESVLNVINSSEPLSRAIETVIASFDANEQNQVLIQPMVLNVAMSGVIMSHVLDDGSPYHVINYDDKTGLTDTVTSGSTINKTIYIYNGVDENDFDSIHLKLSLDLVRRLQSIFPGIPLDIEFAIDKDLNVYLLQLRKITTVKNWNSAANNSVSDRMLFLKDFVNTLFKRRDQLFGSKTMLGFMPDWNPAEMIGVVPQPLSMSLYRNLITKSTWRVAREEMGYRSMPNIDLMVSLFGRVYIDVRASFNSFLPKGLPTDLSEKIINAYLNRLDSNPHLHDKIEFEVVHTAFDFSFDEDFKNRYEGILSDEELLLYREELKRITLNSLRLDKKSSLRRAISKIEHLKNIQKNTSREKKEASFHLADDINNLIQECIRFGTIPFSILARHGFIAESLIRSAVDKGAVSPTRLAEFRKSIVTIGGEMGENYGQVLSGEMSKEAYLNKYGHLRPSSYDILSPTYVERTDLFKGRMKRDKQISTTFELTEQESSEVNHLLSVNGFKGVDAEDLFSYAEEAIKGREYAKFVFTKHLSQILELCAQWGELKGFSRNETAMLTVDEILEVLVSPLNKDVKEHFEEKIIKAKENFKVASSFKLSYLIRSTRDVHIVPMQRSAPNFIGDQRIEAEIIELTPYLLDIPDLRGKIICIEGADPGYDWIFTRNIGGLVTKYGGANSHMAIRCAEFGLPAAIGCGEQPFDRILKAKACLLDCQGKRLEPLEYS